MCKFVKVSVVLFALVGVGLLGYNLIQADDEGMECGERCEEGMEDCEGVVMEEMMDECGDCEEGMEGCEGIEMEGCEEMEMEGCEEMEEGGCEEMGGGRGGCGR